MGVHASPQRLRREVESASPMSSEEKKRDIADFFQPYARPRRLPEQSIPRKRPSPSAEPPSITKSSLVYTQKCPVSTPAKVRLRSDLLSPFDSPASHVSTPRSGSLPFRSPQPKPSVTPASVYKTGKLFEPKKSLEPSGPSKTSTFAFVDLTFIGNKVVKDKEEAVIQDSENDTDSLESLEDIFGRQQDNGATSSSSPPDLDPPELQASTTREVRGDFLSRPRPLLGQDVLRSLSVKTKQPTFNISHILEHHLDDEKTEAKVKKARADYDTSMKQIEIMSQSRLDKNKLACLIDNGQDDNGDISRFLDAVDRTEALSAEKSFSFFKSPSRTSAEEKIHKPPKFPQFKSSKYLQVLQDPSVRARAYMSGHLAELAVSGLLEADIMHWTFQALVFECDIELRQAYIECLKQGSASWTRVSLTAQDLQQCFQMLGATSESIRDGQAINPKFQTVHTLPSAKRQVLLDILDLLRCICLDMDFAALSKYTSILCRLCVDDELMSNGTVAIAVEKCFETLLSKSDDEMLSHITQRIILDMGQTLSEPSLQSSLLSHILPLSTAASQLRARLAKDFMLGVETNPKVGLAVGASVLRHLTEHVSNSSSFDTIRHHSTKDATDYLALKAETNILDIAISNGHRPLSFDSAQLENEFNKSVDALAENIRQRFVAIADTGAAHMQRTEAKDVMQALHARLLYSVRTKPRLRKHIFDLSSGKIREGDEVRAEEREKNFMAQFLTKSGSKSAIGRGSQNKSIVEDVDATPPSENEAIIRKQLQLSQ